MPTYHAPGTRKGNKTWIVRGYINRKQRECVTSASTRDDAEEYWDRWAAEVDRLERLRLERDTLLYVIQCDVAKRVKVGISNDPRARLADLQCGSPTRLVLLGTAHGGRADEQALHETLRSTRTHGEWFEWSEAVRLLLLERFELTDGPGPHHNGRRPSNRP